MKKKRQIKPPTIKTLRDKDLSLADDNFYTKYTLDPYAVPFMDIGGYIGDINDQEAYLNYLKSQGIVPNFQPNPNQIGTDIPQQYQNPTMYQSDMSNVIPGFNDSQIQFAQNNPNSIQQNTNTNTNNTGQKIQGIFDKLPSFQTSTKDIIDGLSLFANIYNSNKVRQSELRQLRNQLVPVTSPVDFLGDDMPLYQERGGSIHIKPENRGKFTRWAKRHGMGVQEAARHVMANKEDYSSAVVKMANFAKNFGGRKKEYGGAINTPLPIESTQNQTNKGYTSKDFVVDPSLANVVAESGEFIQFPDGSTTPITGDRHSDPSGGEYMNLPIDSRIYSDKLKADKEFSTDLLGKKVTKKYSISDLAKKFDTTKDDKVLNSNTSTDLQKRTASINKELKTAKLDEIFKYQEMIKNPREAILNDIREIAPIIAANGTQIPDPDRIVPEGYIPWVEQGTFDSTGQYIVPQPTGQNYLNPRYMFLRPDIQTIATQQTPVPVQTNIPIASPINNLPYPATAQVNTPVVEETITSAPNTISNTTISRSTPRRRNRNNIGGLGDFAPEIFQAIQALNEFPVFTAKYQPTYLRPTEVNVQDNLNRNFAAAAPLLEATGNPSIANARAQQAAANLYDANNTVFQQKYNLDNQNRQQVAQYNNQLENQANLTNLQRADEFWNKVTARQSNKERDLNTIVNSAYAKAKNRQMENRSLDLVNQMFPNYQYNPNSGIQFVQDTQGNLFHIGPNGQLIGINSSIVDSDGKKTTVSETVDSKGRKKRIVRSTEDSTK